MYKRVDNRTCGPPPRGVKVNIVNLLRSLHDVDFGPTVGWAARPGGAKLGCDPHPLHYLLHLDLEGWGQATSELLVCENNPRLCKATKR